MQLRSVALLATAVVGALIATTSPASAAVTVPKYYCETNADCEANYPDTICIEVNSYNEITKKCTPNTKERPACFGTQPGLCPSYQSPDFGYLNVHCVFVAKDPDAKAEVAVASAKASGSGSGKAAARRGRYLMLAATNATGVVKASSAEGSAVGDVVIDDGTGGAGTTPAVVSGGYIKVKIGKEMVTGVFKCVDVSDCDNQAYDPTTCSPLACGSPTSKMQCNNHGTCTYPSIQTMGKRSCKCYAGYGGDKCQQEISNECDVDCGFGGDCINGECKCKKGFDGALFKGKKGKPNQRCTKCTNDQACQNGNACDTETGVCVCSPGFNGPTCGATEDSCTKKNCGIGSCKVFGNGSSACYCPVCAPDCEICKTNDCSTCPAALASAISTSKLVVLLSAVALMVGNLLV